MRYTIPAAGNARLDVATTNRVLRNTYNLLAITLLPTIAGAFLGVQFPLMASVGPWVSLGIFVAAMFGFQHMIEKNRTSAAGVGWLLMYTLVMGYFLGPLLGFALGSFSNGAELIAFAAGGTAAIFFGLAGYATVTKRDFSGLSFGRALIIGMWMMFAISIVNYLFIESSPIALAVSSLVVVISSGFILFTVNRVVRGGEDNYIMATMVIYIMLWNLFSSLLQLLLAFAGNRE